MDEVISPDGAGIPVTGEDERSELRPAQEDPRRHRRRPPVKGPGGVELEVLGRQSRGTPDPGDKDESLLGDAVLGDEMVHGV